jgi:hypothetical protein
MNPSEKLHGQFVHEVAWQQIARRIVTPPKYYDHALNINPTKLRNSVPRINIVLYFIMNIE